MATATIQQPTEIASDQSAGQQTVDETMGASSTEVKAELQTVPAGGSSELQPLEDFPAVIPLKGQRSFLEVMEPDEDDSRPTFTKLHDLADFTTDESARYALACVSFDSARKRLAATNGRTLIIVPVEGEGMPDAMFEADALRKAINDAGSDGKVSIEQVEGQLHLGVPCVVTRNAPAGEGKFPDVYAIREAGKRWRPDVVLQLGTKELERVVKYARRNKLPSITFGMQATNESGVMKQRVDSGVQFTFQDPDADTADPLAVGIVGVIMPMVGDWVEKEKAEEKPAGADGNGDKPSNGRRKAKSATASGDGESSESSRPFPPHGPVTPVMIRTACQTIRFGSVEEAIATMKDVAATIAKDGPEPTWRSYSLAAIGLDEVHQTELEDHGINTVGKLQDAMLADPKGWHKAAGIKRKDAKEKIEAAMGEYLNMVAGGE